MKETVLSLLKKQMFVLKICFKVKDELTGICKNIYILLKNKCGLSITVVLCCNPHYWKGAHRAEWRAADRCLLESWVCYCNTFKSKFVFYSGCSLWISCFLLSLSLSFCGLVWNLVERVFFLFLCYSKNIKNSWLEK